jgi:Protein of unknown function (DUF2877)
MNPAMRANSIGRRAMDSLGSGATGRVLASFSQVCNLVSDEGAVVVLAWGVAEKGPLTVLLDPSRASELWECLAVGTAYRVKPGELWLFPFGSPPVRINLSGAELWDARLHWDALQPKREQVLRSGRAVSRILAQVRHQELEFRWDLRLRQVTEAVHDAHSRRDTDGFVAAVRDLCGLGEGLTPQGDDWLAGWLLGLRLVQPADQTGCAPGALGALVLEVAATRTTLLSRAFLECAAVGEAAEGWHLLLRQMARQPADEPSLHRATRTILSHGATSGAAMLEGFLAGLGLT